MFLVLCKLVQSREVASLGSIAFSKPARFSKGNHTAVHACCLESSWLLAEEVRWDEFRQ